MDVLVLAQKSRIEELESLVDQKNKEIDRLKGLLALCSCNQASNPVTSPSITIVRDDTEYVTLTALHTLMEKRRKKNKPPLDKCCMDVALYFNRKLGRELQEALQMQTNVLSLLSHELRTPLNQVLASCDLIQTTTALTSEQQSLVDLIREGGTLLLDHYNAILELSKLRSGSNLTKSPLNLPTCLEDVVRDLRHKREQKAVTLRTEIDCCIPRFVSADNYLIKRLLWHLIDNAIKFAPLKEGLISIRASCMPFTPATPDLSHSGHINPSNPNNYTHLLVIVIEDNGIGMTSDHLSFIYTPFWQADMSLSRKYGGVGMGIPICQQIVKLSGGDIVFSSQFGKGTTVTVTLPVVEIFVMDSDNDRAMMPTTTNPQTATTTTNNSVNSTCNILTNVYDSKNQQQQPNNMFNKTNNTNNNNGTNNTQHTNYSIGNYANSNSNYTTNNKLVLGELEVLVVEDNPLNMSVMRRMLKNVRITKHDEANDGHEAITAVQKKDYHIVFMDIHMPNVDGISATKEIRRLLGSADRPQPFIMGVTADDQSGVPSKCIVAGMNEVVHKPVKKEYIESALKRFIP